MVLGLDCQAFILWIHGGALGNCPGFHNPVHLQTEVVVQLTGMVLLHHKDLAVRIRSLIGDLWRIGLRGNSEVPLFLIAFKRIGVHRHPSIMV
jgi:hypothetical protein